MVVTVEDLFLVSKREYANNLESARQSSVVLALALHTCNYCVVNPYLALQKRMNAKL